LSRPMTECLAAHLAASFAAQVRPKRSHL
jgi:hypothetical protein